MQIKDLLLFVHSRHFTDVLHIFWLFLEIFSRLRHQYNIKTIVGHNPIKPWGYRLYQTKFVTVINYTM